MPSQNMESLYFPPGVGHYFFTVFLLDWFVLELRGALHVQPVLALVHYFIFVMFDRAEVSMDLVSVGQPDS